MSFFVKAASRPLKLFPEVNAEIAATTSSTQLLRHRHRRQHRAGPGGAGAARRRALSFAEIEKAIAELADRARDGQDRRSTTCRAARSHHQRRRLRLAAVDADPQPAAERHPRDARHPGAPGGARRPGRHPADDVPGADLRPPPRRRPRGGDVPRRASRKWSRTRRGCCSSRRAAPFTLAGIWATTRPILG